MPASLQHILTGCNQPHPMALHWASQPSFKEPCVHPGGQVHLHQFPTRDWKLLVDIAQQFVFPPEIGTPTLRPDLVLWSPSLKKVYIIELTGHWEDSVDEACKRKHLRYSELAAEAQHCGWNTEVCLVEVGCRGFVATSTTKLLWSKHKYLAHLASLTNQKSSTWPQTNSTKNECLMRNT